MKSALPAFVASLAVASASSAALISGWTMPTAFPTGTGNVPTGTTYLPPGPNGAGVADQGLVTAGTELRSVHASAAATYTSPAGNGSQYAFSSNNWTTGDYYQIKLSTAGYENIVLSWDQARSSTGPSAFHILLSIDGGTNFVDLLTYTVLQSGGGGAPGTWSSTTYNALYSNTLSLGAIAADQAQIVVRFQNFEPVASAATGSNRIDNILVNGDAVPAPGALALLGIAGLVGRRRR